MAMASATTHLLSTTPFSTPSHSFPTTTSSSLLSFPVTKKKTHKRKKPLLLIASSTRTGSSTPNTTPSPSAAPDRVLQVHSPAEFDSALAAAKDRLVVVEYAASHSPRSRQIYPVMVDLSRTCSDVDFLLVMGDESDATRELCLREGIHRVPHFSFYKSMQRLHDEEGVAPDQLRGDVLYYGDSHSLVVQLHSREDVEALIEKEKGAKGRLVVLDVGLKHCGPCVKVYPTVMKLSRSMEDMVVFARMNGDENESCMGFLKDMDVVEVPTFLFIRDGEICGRYVGSGKGELIGEILRYQGIKIT